MIVPVINHRELGNYPDHEIIDTTSRSKTWSRGLSPFILGPVKLYGKYVAQNVENAWQFSKIFLPEHLNENGFPNEKYFEWAEKGWSDSYAHRYPFGKTAKPFYSFWDGLKLDYIQARKKIYLPLYIQAVENTEAFKKLMEKAINKEKFVLLDFDGYDYLKLNMTIKDVINNPDKKCGHAFCLAYMLNKL